MGNSAVSQADLAIEEPRVDYISKLPPELVLKILQYVDVTDAIHCRVVSRSWYAIISSFSGYWKEACGRIGLSPLAVEKLARVSDDFPSLVVAALRQKQWLISSSSRHGQFVSLPSKASCNVHIRALIARSNKLGIEGSVSHQYCFIGRMYVLTSDLISPDIYSVSASDETSEKTVTKVFCNPKTSGSISDYMTTLSSSPGQVLWAKASPDYVLLFRHLKGEWIGYCPLSNEIVLHWKSPFKMSFSPFHVASSSTHIACCEACFLVCVAQASSRTSAVWELQILKIGKGSSEPEIASKRTTLVTLRPGEQIVDWVLTPSLSHAGTEQPGFCKLHRLLCQSDTFVCAYEVDLDKPETKMIIKSATAQVPSCRCHVLEPTTKLPTVSSLKISQDHQLLGNVVLPFHLYIWDTQTLQLLTSVELKWAQERHAKELGIIALGHLYSVVHTNDGKPGSFIHIISTKTGELVCERKSRVQWYVGANKFNCVSLLHPEWLSDVYCFEAPILMYVNQSISAAAGVHPLSFIQFVNYKHRSR